MICYVTKQHAFEPNLLELRKNEVLLNLVTNPDYF